MKMTIEEQNKYDWVDIEYTRNLARSFLLPEDVNLLKYFGGDSKALEAFLSQETVSFPFLKEMSLYKKNYFFKEPCAYDFKNLDHLSVPLFCFNEQNQWMFENELTETEEIWMGLHEESIFFFIHFWSINQHLSKLMYLHHLLKTKMYKLDFQDYNTIRVGLEAYLEKIGLI